MLISGVNVSNMVVCYVFHANNRMPKAGDVANYNGAAMLQIVQTASALLLDGRYWTDRNFQNGLNTAGCLKLEKISERI